MSFHPDQDYGIRRFHSRVATYDVCGPTLVLSKIARMSAPYLQSTQLGSASSYGSPSWTFNLRPAPRSGDDVNPSKPDAADERYDVHTLSVSIEARHEWLPVLALRWLRTIDRCLSIARGAIPIHGSFVSLHGIGVILVGDHRAGKTTAALSAVRTFGGRLISNDDPLLYRIAHGLAWSSALRDVAWLGVGSPRSTGVRWSSIGEHRPALEAAELRRMARMHPGIEVDKVYLAPSELVEMGVPVGIKANVHLVIDLCVHDTSAGAIEPLTDMRARETLGRWLEPIADRYRLDFLEAIGALGRIENGEALRELSSTLQIYRYEHAPVGWVEGFLAHLQPLIGAGERGRV